MKNLRYKCGQSYNVVYIQLILLRCLKLPTFDVIEGVLVYFVEPIYVVVIQKRKISEDQEGSVFTSS